MLYNDLPKPINRIFIDLDDTLVDFMGTVYDLIYSVRDVNGDKDWVKFEEYINRGGGDTKMWPILNQLGPTWWENLPKLPWADDIWNLCNAICPNVAILTSPGKSPEAAAGKMLWAAKNYGTENLIVTKKKHMCACPGSILIDDWDKFSIPWHENGGIPILMTREWTNKGHTPGEIITALIKYRKVVYKT